MNTVGRTRMHLLMLKRRIEVAKRGLELLRSKREALARELFLVADRVLESRGQLEAEMRRALSALALALAMEGRAPLQSAGYATRRSLSLHLTERNVWGVRFPELQYQPILRSPDARGYAVSGVSTYIDETARHFEWIVELILKGVVVEMRLKRVGDEIKRVTRRINALNEIVIPALAREARMIRQALEERAREDLFRMKRFKQGRAQEAGR